MVMNGQESFILCLMELILATMVIHRMFKR